MPSHAALERLPLEVLVTIIEDVIYTQHEVVGVVPDNPCDDQQDRVRYHDSNGNPTNIWLRSTKHFNTTTALLSTCKTVRAAALIVMASSRYRTDILDRDAEIDVMAVHTGGFFVTPVRMPPAASVAEGSIIRTLRTTLRFMDTPPGLDKRFDCPSVFRGIASRRVPRDGVEAFLPLLVDGFLAHGFVGGGAHAGSGGGGGATVCRWVIDVWAPPERAHSWLVHTARQMVLSLGWRFVAAIKGAVRRLLRRQGHDFDVDRLLGGVLDTIEIRYAGKVWQVLKVKNIIDNPRLVLPKRKSGRSFEWKKALVARRRASRQAMLKPT